VVVAAVNPASGCMGRWGKGIRVNWIGGGPVSGQRGGRDSP
jgi:hypothetical protein